MATLASDTFVQADLAHGGARWSRTIVGHNRAVEPAGRGGAREGIGGVRSPSLLCSVTYAPNDCTISIFSGWEQTQSCAFLFHC